MAETAGVATLDVINSSNEKVGTVELPAETFDVQTNVPLIHQVVVAQRAAARRARTTRSVVARSPVLGASRSSRREPVALVRARSAPPR